ncbi:uncharacterized protein EDB93DRAFT_1109994 [Suillus bovinus]|uniref:uncharacterized protein n=1 Tax=Suillus bovinus TaxID=48563 RepID=UPI001B86BF42|nr:uncharacterized protein EDB93DRAFT_1109994 [Suillus bovinus]KAG2125774.1 hypothetical protein EDB93DRAFT_1109994 [Suillus bovinus]
MILQKIGSVLGARPCVYARGTRKETRVNDQTVNEFINLTVTYPSNRAKDSVQGTHHALAWLSLKEGKQTTSAADGLRRAKNRLVELRADSSGMVQGHLPNEWKGGASDSCWSSWEGAPDNFSDLAALHSHAMKSPPPAFKLYDLIRCESRYKLVSSTLSYDIDDKPQDILHRTSISSDAFVCSVIAHISSCMDYSSQAIFRRDEAP